MRKKKGHSFHLQQKKLDFESDGDAPTRVEESDFEENDFEENDFEENDANGDDSDSSSGYIFDEEEWNIPENKFISEDTRQGIEVLRRACKTSFGNDITFVLRNLDPDKVYSRSEFLDLCDNQGVDEKIARESGVFDSTAREIWLKETLVGYFKEYMRE